jgi:hypothetical protein
LPKKQVQKIKLNDGKTDELFSIGLSFDEVLRIAAKGAFKIEKKNE